MSAETLAMPFRCEPHAPSFAGDDDEGLLDFVDQFDALADACKLTDDEKCDSILRYVDRPSKQLWLTLAGYELRDYQKFKNDILYQYPVAWKAAQRRSAQLARHRTPEKIERPAQIVHGPASNVPTSTASSSRLSELAPPAPVARPVVPVPVRTAPVPVARPVIPVPATVVRNAHAVPAPAARRDLAPPIVRPALAVSAVRLVHASPVVHRAPSRAGHLYSMPGPVDRRSLAAPFVRHDHATPPPFTFHPAAASLVPSTAALPFSLRPDLTPSAPVAARPPPSPVTFVPPVYTPTPLPFPLCLTSEPSASVTAEVQPSSIETKSFEPAPTRHQHREYRPNDRRALVESHEQVVECPSHRCENEKDVAILKEEGRGQQAVVQPNDDQNEQHRAIEREQEVETPQRILPQKLDENTKRESAGERKEADDEDERQEIVDEDRTRTVDEQWTRIADEEQKEVKHRQENIEQVQQNSTHARNDREIDTSPVPVPVSPPAPELSSEHSPELDTLDTRIVPILSPEPHVPIVPPEPETAPPSTNRHSSLLEKITPVRISVPHSQHARLSPFQQVVSKIHLPRVQFKREKTVRTTRSALLTAISRCNGPLPIIQLFVPPRRKRRYRPRLARTRGNITQWQTPARPVSRVYQTTARKLTECIRNYTEHEKLLRRNYSPHALVSSPNVKIISQSFETLHSRFASVTDLECRFASTVRAHDLHPRAFRRKTEVAVVYPVATVHVRRKSSSHRIRVATSLDGTAPAEEKREH